MWWVAVSDYFCAFDTKICPRLNQFERRNSIGQIGIGRFDIG